MVKDQNGNELKDGAFVLIQLNSNQVKGHIQQIIEGGALMPGAGILLPRGIQKTPTTIVVMCPVTVTIHDGGIATNLITMVEPETQPAERVQ